MFEIEDNTLLWREQIYGRKIQCNCVCVLISYQNNIPISASLSYEPDDSNPLPESLSIITAVLQYIHTQIPEIKEVNFMDDSMLEDEPFYYFSIAFNGETWYEKYFRARQKHHHEKYKERIHTLLYLPETKAAISFRRFLEIAKPPFSLLEELQSHYERGATFDQFFNHIPKVDRFRLVRDWISAFMEHYLNGVFTNIDWVIDLPIVSSVGGGKTRKYRYYCPKGRVLRNGGTKKTFLVDAMDI
jgi:hypothetical protein